MLGPPSYLIRKPAAVLSVMGAMAIVGLNIALILQNHTLKKEMAAPPGLVPQVGMKVDQLEGAALDGAKVQVSFTNSDKETLLFVFSTNCHICNLNWPQWQAIARSADGKRLRFIYANIQSTLDREYAVHYGIDGGTLFAELDPRDEAALNLRLTPLTVLLSPNGEVMNVWVGLLEREELSDLRRTLGLETS